MSSKLLMAWGGTDPAQTLQYSIFDGKNWSAPIVNNAMGTSFMPSLAVYNGTIYMAWKGVDRAGGQVDVKIYYSTFDGSNWAPQQIVPGVGTSGGVSLTVLDDKLFLAWKGQNDDTRMFYSTFDGSSWAPQQVVPEGQTNVGPSIIAF